VLGLVLVHGLHRRAPMRCMVALAVMGLAGCATEDELDLDNETVASPVEVPPAPRAGVAFGRDTSERIYGVRIHDQAHRQPKVVYSVRLVDVRADERLRLRGEVALSRCNTKDIAGESGDAAHTPCDSPRMRSSPYDYAPRFSAAFVLANSPTDATGQRVSPWFERTCNEGQHHCALALPEVGVDSLPDAAEKFVNLVVTADAQSHNARDWHVMEVEQNKGALAVTRLGADAGGRAISERSVELRSPGHMGIDRPHEDGDPTQVRHLLYQVKLTGLRGGDVVDADANVRAVLDGGYSCDPLITTEIIVTQDRDAKDVRDAHDERITIRNGANCSDHSNDGCRYVESGAVRLEANVPATMFVSYYALALRSCAEPGGNDTWHVRDGELAVNVRR
jgi:hypothetical protein